jgi:hypothetical protein
MHHGFLVHIFNYFSNLLFEIVCYLIRFVQRNWFVYMGKISSVACSPILLKIIWCSLMSRTFVVNNSPPIYIGTWVCWPVEVVRNSIKILPTLYLDLVLAAIVSGSCTGVIIVWGSTKGSPCFSSCPFSFYFLGNCLHAIG